jgi:hypothetical protein
MRSWPALGFLAEVTEALLSIFAQQFFGAVSLFFVGGVNNSLTVA